VSRVVLGIAEEAYAPHTFTAEHLDWLVDVLLALGNRSAKVLSRQLRTVLDDAMMSAGPDAAVHRVALVAQVLGTVEAVVRGHYDRRRVRTVRLAEIARRPL